MTINDNNITKFLVINQVFAGKARNKMTIYNHNSLHDGKENLMEIIIAKRINLVDRGR